MDQYIRLGNLSHCVLSHSLKIHVQLSSGPRDLTFDLKLHIPSSYVYASNEGSVKTAHMRSLARAFAARTCNKFKNLTNWLTCCFYNLSFDLFLKPFLIFVLLVSC